MTSRFDSLLKLYTEGLLDQIGASSVAGVTGAQSIVGGIKQVEVAKIQSALRAPAKLFLQAMYRSKVIPGAERSTPSDQDATAFITSIMPFINQLRMTISAQIQATQTKSSTLTPPAQTPAPPSTTPAV
jgi:hypothetical protein